jgi:enoyl-[acyl-carrier protein] reductase II
MAAESSLANRYTRMAGIDFPIVQEGMGPFNTASLAAAVSESGGLGTVSVPGTSGDLTVAAREFRLHIEECAQLTTRQFAVNIPVGHSRNGGIAPFAKIYIDTVLQARREDSQLASQLRILTTSAGFPTGITELVHDAGMLHQHKVGSTRHAVKAAEAGVDAIIASGLEMGGHAPKSGMHTFVLVANVADAVSIPIVLSGGVRDGRGLAAALCLGADAVALGTRFAASTDNPDWHARYGDAILGAHEGDDRMLEGVFGPCRVLKNAASDRIVSASVTDHPVGSSEKIELMRKAQIEGDVDDGLVLLGQVASGIDELISVRDFIPAMAKQAEQLLSVLSSGR